MGALKNKRLQLVANLRSVQGAWKKEVGEVQLQYYLTCLTTWLSYHNGSSLCGALASPPNLCILVVTEQWVQTKRIRRTPCWFISLTWNMSSKSTTFQSTRGLRL